LLVTCLYGCLSDPQAFSCLVLVAVHISSFSQNPPASSSVSKYNQRHGLSSKFRTKTTSEKQGEREREREQATEPTWSRRISDAEDVNRRTKEEDEGQRRAQGQRFPPSPGTEERGTRDSRGKVPYRESNGAEWGIAVVLLLLLIIVCGTPTTNSKSCS